MQWEVFMKTDNSPHPTFGKHIRLCSLILCFLLLFSAVPVTTGTAQAAVSWPSFSDSKPIRVYPLDKNKKYPVYRSNHKKYNSRKLSGSEKVYIKDIKGNWAHIRYTSGGKTKTGYVPMSTFTSASAPQTRNIAQVKLKTYRYSTGTKTAETVYKTRTVYTLGSSGNRVQILFNVVRSHKQKGWQIAWVNRADYNKLVADSSSSTLKITGLAKPTLLTVGAAFSCVGTVSSNRNISEVRVWITNASNKVVTSHTAYPNAKTFSLSEIDPYILFNNAKAGTNYYKIQAKDDRKTVSVSVKYTVKARPAELKPFDEKAGGASDFLGYAPYNGINYRTQTSDRRRILALDKAKKMATVKWQCAATFPTWFNSEGYYSTTKATDGTVSDCFLKGKKYVGIPFSMVNHSYDDVSWANFVKAGYTWNDIAKAFYSYSNKTTAKGSDCSYFVYLAMLAGGAKVTYQTTYMMYNGRYYKKIKKSSLKPGDILLSQDHVRLYTGRAGSKYAVFESTATGSKTRYKLFTAAELSGYEAYRYKQW